MGVSSCNHWRLGSSQADHNGNSSHRELSCISPSWRDGVSPGAPVDAAESCCRQVSPVLDHSSAPGRTWSARENGS
eukprot:10360692-Karenia_brevis.AAC.1